MLLLLLNYSLHVKIWDLLALLAWVHGKSLAFAIWLLSLGMSLCLGHGIAVLFTCFKLRLSTWLHHSWLNWFNLIWSLFVLRNQNRRHNWRPLLLNNLAIALFVDMRRRITNGFVIVKSLIWNHIHFPVW